VHVLLFWFFWDRVPLCSLDCSQTHNLTVSVSSCWDYWCAPIFSFKLLTFVFFLETSWLVTEGLSCFAHPLWSTPQFKFLLPTKCSLILWLLGCLYNKYSLIVDWIMNPGSEMLILPWKKDFTTQWNSEQVGAGGSHMRWFVIHL
jgi:hypothetical protein